MEAGPGLPQGRTQILRPGRLGTLAGSAKFDACDGSPSPRVLYMYTWLNWAVDGTRAHLEGDLETVRGIWMETALEMVGDGRSGLAES
jgi:hypothetical protein